MGSYSSVNLNKISLDIVLNARKFSLKYIDGSFFNLFCDFLPAAKVLAILFYE